MIRFCQLAVSILLVALIGSLIAPAASATGSGSPGSSFPSGVEELCNHDCVVRGEVPDRGDGSPFEFELGLAAVTGGLDLVLETEGSVYLAGPLDALTTIELNAGDIRIGDGMGIGSEVETRLHGRVEVTILVPNMILSPPGLIQIGGGGVSLAGSGSFVAAQGVLAPVADSMKQGMAGSTDATISISRSGDIYLDLSGVQLGSLSVRAGHSIVSQDATIAFVPEPTTALLLGLGMAAMGTRRRNSRALEVGGRRARLAS